MKCFNHQENDAVGLCKNCSKGLCKECAKEVHNSIACSMTCIEELKQIDSIIKRNKQSYKTTSSSLLRSAFMYLGFGLVFIIYGLISKGLMGFLSILGILFIIGGIFNIISAKKYRKEQ